MFANAKFRGALLSLLLLGLLIGGLAHAAPPNGRPAAPDTATILLSPIADSFVNLNSSANFGGAADLHVEYNPVGPTYSRALIQFSLADLAYQLPEGATILTATLKLHMGADAPVTETLTVHTGSGAEWAEDTVNWANQPAWGSPSAALSVGTVHGDKVWDVTAILQGWLDGSLPNRGLGLLGPESGLAYSFSFDSRTGAFPPQLAVTYQAPPPTPPPPTQIPIPQHPPLAGEPAVVLSGDTAVAGSQVRATGFDFPDDLCTRYDTFMLQNIDTPVLIGGTEPLEGNMTTLVFTVPVSAKGHYNIVTLGGGHQAATHLDVTATALGS